MKKPKKIFVIKSLKTNKYHKRLSMRGSVMTSSILEAEIFEEKWVREAQKAKDPLGRNHVFVELKIKQLPGTTIISEGEVVKI